MSDKVNVLCLKWGRYYSVDYVNRLYANVRAHLKRPFRFVCVTDRTDGVDPHIDCAPMPPDPGLRFHKWPNVHAKPMLFKKGYAGLEGPTLFLDIDLLVIGELDKFFDYRPGDFCIIHNWVELRKRLFRKLPDIGNSSCFRFDAGTDVSNGVYECFMRDKGNPELDYYFRHGSQKFQTRAMKEVGTVSWWPDEWVASFKRTCIPVFPFNLFMTPRRPKTASIVAFHGHPDLPEAISGFTVDRKGVKVPPHLKCRPTPWVKDAWENPGA